MFVRSIYVYQLSLPIILHHERSNARTTDDQNVIFVRKKLKCKVREKVSEEHKLIRNHSSI